MSKTDVSALDGEPKLGLVAGWGRYPVLIAEAARRQGHQIFCIGISGHADPALRTICHDYCQQGLARLGGCLRYFRDHGVGRATMAGKVHKSEILGADFLWKYPPDWRAIRTFYPHFIAASKDRRDDTLLQAIVDSFAQEGISFAPATDYLPELLAQPGLLSGRTLSQSQARDVEFGWQLAKGIGGLDIGQTVAVKGRAVLAVEAVEGTDDCIRRAGSICRRGGFTVVKVAKPQQDMRFDVPTIGLGTVKTLVAAGGKVLAIEAEKTIILDEPAVIDYAQWHNVAILSLRDSQIPQSLMAA